MATTGVFLNTCHEVRTHSVSSPSPIIHSACSHQCWYCIEHTCVVDEDVQTFLVLLDVFGQVPDGLQGGEVQFLHHHVAVAALLPDLVGHDAGFGHVSAGQDHSGSFGGAQCV